MILRYRQNAGPHSFGADVSAATCSADRREPSSVIQSTSLCLETLVRDFSFSFLLAGFEKILDVDSSHLPVVVGFPSSTWSDMSWRP